MMNYIHNRTVTQGLDESLEAQAVDRFFNSIETIKSDLRWYWHWGDGEGGWVLEQFADMIRGAGYNWPHNGSPKSKLYQKAKIGRELSKSVMERDLYRCVSCGTHLDLCCDHIIPEIRGGATSFDNLQTMCRSCNSRKGVK
jgi:hypothetical protein